MTKEIAYYSLIQYCPDQVAGEVANIGLLIFSPKTGYVDVRTTKSNSRVAHIFGGGVHKYDSLQRYKEGLSEWVEGERNKFESMEGAKRFLAAYANSVCFSGLRSIVCPNGAKEMLGSLFAKFFPGDKAPEETTPRGPYFPRKRIVKTLREKYGNKIAERIAILPELEVMGPEKKIEPAFAFQNRHFNVVFSKSFTDGHYADQVAFGALISSRMRMAQQFVWSQSQPVILGRVSKAIADQTRFIRESLASFNVEFYDSEVDLIDYIGREAKPLPDAYKDFAAIKVEPTLF